MRGVYVFGQAASYEGAVEGLTFTRPIKPLGREVPANSSTTAPTGAPHAPPPPAHLVQPHFFGSPWAPWAPFDLCQIMRFLRS